MLISTVCSLYLEGVFIAFEKFLAMQIRMIRLNAEQFK